MNPSQAWAFDSSLLGRGKSGEVCLLCKHPLSLPFLGLCEPESRSRRQAGGRPCCPNCASRPASCRVPTQGAAPRAAGLPVLGLSCKPFGELPVAGLLVLSLVALLILITAARGQGDDGNAQQPVGLTPAAGERLGQQCVRAEGEPQEVRLSKCVSPRVPEVCRQRPRPRRPQGRCCRCSLGHTLSCASNGHVPPLMKLTDNKQTHK